VYDYNPVPPLLDRVSAKFIIGAEGTIWTEFFKTNSYVQYMLLPRMLALSEVGWSANENKNWDGFLKKMPYQFKLFGKEKWDFDSKDILYEEIK
jgi:hexosaminidase